MKRILCGNLMFATQGHIHSWLCNERLLHVHIPLQFPVVFCLVSNSCRPISVIAYMETIIISVYLPDMLGPQTVAQNLKKMSWCLRKGIGWLLKAFSMMIGWFVGYITNKDWYRFVSSRNIQSLKCSCISMVIFIVEGNYGWP